MIAHRRLWASLGGPLVLLLASSLVGAEPSPSLSYVVDLADARNHYVWVELKVPAAGAETELMMAVWTPGSYLVREYARHLDSMSAADPDGNPIAFEKVRKNRWRFQTEGVSELLVRYRLYANEMSVRTNWVGQQFAVLNGAATFLTRPDLMDVPHSVRLRLPEPWTRSATSLRGEGDEAQMYRAENFDELVDSPIVAGQIEIFPFEVGGVPHQLVQVNDRGFWDGQQAARDLAKVVQAHHDLWGQVPYDRYLFLNVLGESGGGLEHDNSCLMLSSRWTFRDPGRYRSWLSLASHEFFHAWNVRRLRPRALIEYDYENEEYTRSLWVAEGVTTYYEDLLLVRAGLMSSREFLSGLSRSIASVQGTPGRLRQSLADSSYDAWIKFYRSDENSRNTRISYYTKGAVAAMLLDAEIRASTGNAKSLDDVMRTLYERHLETGYTPGDFRAVAADVAGVNLDAWFARAVDSTAEFDFTVLKDVFGLEFPGDNIEVVRESTEEEGEGDGESAEWATEFARRFSGRGDGRRRSGTPHSGFRTSGSERVTVQSVEADSPATEAGIHTDDEIVGLNGFRISGDPSRQLRAYQPGDRVEWLIARRGELMTLPMTLGEQTAGSWNLVEVDEPSESQTAARAAWLSAASVSNGEAVADEENGDAESAEAAGQEGDRDGGDGAEGETDQEKDG